MTITHAFSLYRSGYSDENAFPWPDNQLWASEVSVLTDNAENAVILRPDYGSAAALYRVRLFPAESAELGWVSWRIQLEIDNSMIGNLPISWYVGNPSDWPSGIARYPERYGPFVPPGRGAGWNSSEGPRGVWTLTARRNS